MFQKWTGKGSAANVSSVVTQKACVQGRVHFIRHASTYFRKCSVYYYFIRGWALLVKYEYGIQNTFREFLTCYTS